jgi:outer membrane protein, heavy metal efflux system
MVDSHYQFIIRIARPARAPLLIALVVGAQVGAPAVCRAQSAPPAREPAITVRQVLDSVAARYPELEASRARVRAARGSRRTAGTLGNPVLAYQAENAPFPGGPPIAGMARENMSTATLPLAPLYQRWPQVRRAEAEVRAAEADALAARQRVTLDAARAYYRTALAQVSAASTQDVAGWLDTLVAYNRTRVREGVAAEADLLRSELERDRAVADASLEAAELARARAQLAAFVGEPGPGSTELVVALEDAPLVMPSAAPDSAPALGVLATSTAAPTRIGARGGAEVAPGALERRPEVRAARERLAAAGAGTGIEQTMIIRELGATIGVKQTAGVNSMIAGLSLPLPLFNQNRGELTRARAERDAAAFELAARERSARADLAGAAEAARILTDRAVELARRQPEAGDGRPAYLARADEARAIALGAYREGAAPLLQVLDAARAWAEARVAYYRTLYAQHEAVLGLVVARGDDLVAAVAALTPAPVRGASTRANPHD